MAISDMTDSQRWLTLALVVFVGWVIYLLAPILTPFVVSAVFAYLGDPVTDRLEERGLSRTGAVIVVFSLLTLGAAIVLLILIPMLVEQIGRLAQQLPGMVSLALSKLQPWLAKLELSFDPSSFTEQVRSHLDEIGSFLGPVVGSLGNVLGGLGRGGAAVLTLLMNLALIPVVTFYLLRDWDLLVERVHELIPRQWEPNVVRLASESDEVLGSFLRGQLSVMVALGLIYSIGLMLVGLDLALLIGMTAGLVSFVPYLGAIFGVVAAVLATLFQHGDMLHLVLVLAVFGVGQMLEGMVLTPLLVGDRIGLHPVAVIFAVLAGGQLFGFVGVLIGLPVAAVANVMLRHAHERYLRSRLYGANADPGAPASVPELAESTAEAIESEPRPPDEGEADPKDA